MSLRRSVENTHVRRLRSDCRAGVDRDTGTPSLAILFVARNARRSKNASGMQKGADDLEDLRLNLEIMEGL
jgi:hypothetical protein